MSLRHWVCFLPAIGFGILAVLAVLTSLPSMCSDSLCGIIAVLLGAPWTMLIASLPESLLDSGWGIALAYVAMAINLVILIWIG